MLVQRLSINAVYLGCVQSLFCDIHDCCPDSLAVCSLFQLIETCIAASSDVLANLNSYSTSRLNLSRAHQPVLATQFGFNGRSDVVRVT